MSRPKRWAAAIAALQALDASEIDELKEAYQEWLDNLPEGLDASPCAEKLEATVDAAEMIVDALAELTSALEEAEGVDLPLGFGRD